MKKILYIIIIGFLGYVGYNIYNHLQTSSDNIKIGIINSKRPWFETSNINQIDTNSFEYNITIQICRIVNKKCTIITDNYKNIESKLISKDIDIMLGNFKINDENKHKLNFSSALLDFGSVFLTSKSNKIKPQETLNQTAKLLNNKITGVIENSTHEEFINNNFKGRTSLFTYKDYKSLFRALYNDNIDYIFVPMQIALNHINEHNVVFELHGYKSHMIADQYHIATTKDNPMLLQNINNIIKQLHSSGVIKKYTEKYFKYNAEIIQR